jgi:hypothetical protein
VGAIAVPPVLLRSTRSESSLIFSSADGSLASDCCVRPPTLFGGRRSARDDLADVNGGAHDRIGVRDVETSSCAP